MTNTKDCPERRYPLLNKVMFIGRLVRDGEVKYLESGTQITHFSVALDGAGNRGTEAAFIDFSKIGEFNVAEYLKKGTQVFVEGHIDQARKEVDGQKRTFTNFMCDRLRLLSARRNFEEINSIIDGNESDAYETSPTQVDPLDFEDANVGRVFLHIQEHRSITEAELVAMLGSTRKVRSFSLKFDEYARKVPFPVRIETTSIGKRYTRQSY